MSEAVRFTTLNLEAVAELAVEAAAELPPPTDAENWRALAVCQRFSPDLFYPDVNGAAGRRYTNAAKVVCSHCPVKMECLNESLEKGESYGVWGGLDQDERLKILRNTTRRQYR